MARQPWLRLYTAILDSPKLQLLPDRLFRLVINLWCLAKENDGVLPLPEHCAFRLRLTLERYQAAFQEVKHLFDTHGTSFKPHDWDQHQYVGDGSADLSNQVEEFRAEVLARDGGRCAYCGSTANLVMEAQEKARESDRRAHYHNPLRAQQQRLEHRIALQRTAIKDRDIQIRERNTYLADCLSRIEAITGKKYSGQLLRLAISDVEKKLAEAERLQGN